MYKDTSNRRIGMYKLIAIDLDGTLLNDEKNIPSENIKIINELINKGYEVVFATGRRYLAARQFIDCFKEDLVIVANNGNMVRHTRGDELIHAEYLQSECLEFVINEGKKLDLHPTIHINKFEQGVDMVFELEREDERYHKYLIGEDRALRVDDFLKEDLKVLSIVYLGDYKKLETLNNKILSAYPENYTTYLMQNIALADGLLEVVKPNSSKWKSLIRYANSIGIEKSEILAIGDDANDVEMIEEAGFGISMKNGVEKLKGVADAISEFNNNDAGVARELRKLLSL